MIKGFIEKGFGISIIHQYISEITKSTVIIFFIFSAECPGDWVKTRAGCYKLLLEQSSFDEAVVKCKEEVTVMT